jgi:PPM family protein phosphatase
VHACALSDAGRRRADNEDSVLADEQSGLLVVSDGMGGHAAGEVASALAIDVIRVCFSDGNRPARDPAGGHTDIETRLVTAIERADRAIRDHALGEPALTGMGTTVVAAIALDASVVVAHVGDSRAYLLRDGALVRLTEDHTLVAEMIRTGQITPQRARTHRLRNVLTRSVGNGRHAPSIDVRSLDWSPPDRLLLCSDGLSTAVPDRRIRSVMVQAGPDLEAACRLLVAAANEAGGKDNISVIVAAPGGQDRGH